MIDICNWRASIGLWYCHQIPYTIKKTPFTTDSPGCVKSLLMTGNKGGGTLIFSLVLFLLILLILSGDIELNPGPKTELTSNNALRLLVKSGFVVKEKWNELTSLLGVSLEERRRLKTMTNSDQDYHFALEEGIQWWITNGTVPSWEELVSVVESCGDVDVAYALRRQLDINDAASFLYQEKTDRQKEGIFDQVGDQTFSSCDKSVYVNVEGTSAVESDEVHKVLKSALTSHFSDLSNQLSRCLPRVSAAMYSKRLISESVRDYPTVYSIVGEFESGMKLINTISKLQEHCQLFLQCLYSEGGPMKLAAQKLCQDWIEEVKKQCDISLDLTCDEQHIKQQNNGNATEKVMLEDEKNEAKLQTALERQHEHFSKLMVALRSALDLKLQHKQLVLVDFIRWIEHRMNWVGELGNIDDLNELFKKLHPHFDFLDCKLIVDMSEMFLNDEYFGKDNTLVNELKEHMVSAKELRSLSTVKQLKNDLKKIYFPYQANLANMPHIQIELHNPWYEANIEALYLLIGHLLPHKSKHSILKHIEIETGSVRIKYFVNESKVDCLIAYAESKLQFIRLIGIFGLTINGDPVLEEDENMNFSFELALLEATKAGHNEAMQFLLEVVGNVDYCNEEGETALMLASKGGHEQIVQTLLSAGANVNILDNIGYTALMLACNTNSYTIVNYLLQAGANPDIQNNACETAIIEACQNNHSDIVRLLLQFNADPLITSRNDDTSLTVATRQNSIEIVEMLLEHLAESQKSSAVTSALTTACQYGHSQTIICLLVKLLDIYAPEEFQLFVSCAEGDHDTIKKHIYDTNVNINSTLGNGVTPLMIASSCGHTETVHVLLKAGANIHSTDNNEYSPLVYAITGHRSLQVIEQLLKAGAQPNVFINDQSIADKAREERNKDLCKLLQQFSAIKIKKNKEEIIEQLLTIFDSFTILNAAIQSCLQKVITEGTVLFVDVIEFLHHYLGYTELKVDNIDQLFNVLQPHYYFLNVDLLSKIMDKFFGGKLQNRLQDYISMVKAFEETTQLQLFGQAIKHTPLLHPPVTTTQTCTMIIKFHEQWQQKNVAHMHTFLNYSFSKETRFLNHIVIEEEGSACVCNFVVPKTHIDSLVVIAVEKRQFMYQLGVYEVYIGDQPILIEDYNYSFSFRHVLQNSIKAEDDMLTSFLMEINVSIHSNISLHEAARHGNIDAIELLLKKHVDINIVDKNGVTALMLASGNGHTQVIELLLKEHPNINLQAKNGVTALMIASLNGHTQIVELLLKEHANINTQEEDGWTALMLASLNGYHQVVKLLIKKHADINLQAKNGFSALMLASQNGHLQVVELLLKEHADGNTQNEDGWTSLMLASRNCHLLVVELLLKEHADVNIQKEDGWTALMIASFNGHYQALELLLKEYANINHQGKDGVSAVMLASQNGYHQVVEQLLKEHANINLQDKNGVTALMLGSYNGHYKVVELLLKEHAEVNLQAKNGLTAVMLASQNGHLQVVELLLKEHANIDLQAKDGLTALMLATRNGHLQVIELLLKEHANVNIQEEDGWTALMLASQNGHIQVVELLLKEHANVNIQKEDGWTALMLASQNGHIQVVEILLKEHANINTQNKNGLDALMIAGFSGQTQAVKCLLQWDADVSILCKGDYNALMLASQNGHLEVVECLLHSQVDSHLSASDGSTAFSLAAYSGNRDIVNMLLDKVKPTTDEIEKAVVLSCLGGHPTLIAFLLNKLPHLIDDQRDLIDSCVKGDLAAVIMKTLDCPDTPLVLGLTPLMLASSCGHADIVDALTQAGADVNKQENNWGYTALFFAIIGGKSLIIVETLLERNANPNVIVDKRTPLDEANDIKQESICELLTKYGGQTGAKLKGTKEKETKSSLIALGELNTSVKQLQPTHEQMKTLTYGDSYTIQRETKQKRFQIPSPMSMLHLLTPYILNPTHTFRNTNVKQDNKKEVKEVYTVNIN